MVKCSICGQEGVNKNSAGRLGVKGKVDHPCIPAPAPGPVADEAPAPAASLGNVELYVLVSKSLDRLDGVLRSGVLGDDDGVLRSDELCRAFDDLRLVECELLRRHPSLAARGHA